MLSKYRQNHIRWGYVTPQFHEFDGRRRNTIEHVTDADPCMKEFLNL